MGELHNVLTVKNLSVSYDDVKIVRDVTFSLKKGEFLGIVGESGCGKTTMLRALMMLRKGNSSISGTVQFQNRELTELSEEELRRLRGADISMIPQNASISMDPTKTISALFYETIRMHGEKISRKESNRRAAEIMEALLLSHTDRILKSYPFELSGGMCQRVMIAAAMINNPQLMLGDEPTSALDVNSQLQVIKQLKMLKENFHISLVVISHNLGVISNISDQIAIMYGGRIVEYGPCDQVLKTPLHPYTKALIAAVPDADGNISKGLAGVPPIFEKDMRGCPFAERCSHCLESCRTELPGDTLVGEAHSVQCFRVKEWI